MRISAGDRARPYADRSEFIKGYVVQGQGAYNFSGRVEIGAPASHEGKSESL